MRLSIRKTYVSQVLRLTLLAPEIVEAILDGRRPADVGWMICLPGFRSIGLGHRRHRRMLPSRRPAMTRCRNSCILALEREGSQIADWRIRGEYMEACNCSFLCPCIGTNLEARPTEGDCKAAISMRIDEGEKDGVRLGGLAD
jgi:hypothetical protein